MPDEVPALTGRTRTVVGVGVAVVVAAGLPLRFWTRSGLWLDEALTVDVARLPLHELSNALKHDGAPPLYYVLLHFWMGLFGQSNDAVRALSGVFAVLTLPVGYLCGRRFGGRRWRGRWWCCWPPRPSTCTTPPSRACTRWSSFSPVSGSSPSSGRSGRPARATSWRWPSSRPHCSIRSTGRCTWWRWSRSARRVHLAHPPSRPPRRCAVGRAHRLGGRVLLFVPWVPTFLYQAKHTGTPGPRHRTSRR